MVLLLFYFFIFFFIFRNYIESDWCREEFSIAHQEMLKRRTKYLIVVLADDLDIESLPDELRMYLRTYTYIDARDHEESLDKIRKKIRFAMPGTPLARIRELQEMQVEEEGEGEEDADHLVEYCGLEHLVQQEEEHGTGE